MTETTDNPLANINIEGRTWFDKVNGNTYHSARVFDKDRNLLAVAEFQYGYGDQYVDSAVEALQEAARIDLPPARHGGLDYRKADIGHYQAHAVTKRECEEWGER